MSPRGSKGRTLREAAVPSQFTPRAFCGFLADAYLVRAVPLDAAHYVVFTGAESGKTFALAPGALEVPGVFEVAQIIATRAKGILA